MRVQNFDLTLSAAHRAQTTYEREQTLRVTAGAATPAEGSTPSPGAPHAIHAMESSQALDLLSAPPPASMRRGPPGHAVDATGGQPDAPGAVKKTDDEEMLASDDGDADLLIIKGLIEALTGHRMRLLSLKGLAEAMDAASVQEADTGGPSASAPAWGMHYHLHERYVESETTTFSARGAVRTVEGRTIEFQLQLSMRRRFVAEKNVDLRQGAALKDPLVINLDERAVGLGEASVRFDLDADGTKEAIASLAPGSAFLALDRNEDGVVNDGRELFGLRSGDGFAELAQLDSDGNAWIDEADPAYARLKVWSPDASGNGTLQGLAEAGVGAVYLGAAATPFALKDGDNALRGAVRQTGIFLAEEGGVGTLQQIDLAV